MHLFEDYTWVSEPSAATWLSTIPYWILDWQNTDYYIQELIDEYYKNAGPGPDRRDAATQLPVGPENILGTPAQPGIELSNLVIAEQELPVSPPPPGSTMPLSDKEWFEQMFPGQVFQPPGAPAQIVEDTTVSVWDDLGDAYDRFDATIGGILPGGAPLFGSAPPPQILGPNVTVVGGGGGGVPPIPPGTAVGACVPSGPQPVFKQVCGVYKWVYPKRRRRRALLTEGDYNALLRIESLKVNKNMTAAIAKALTR